MLYNFFEYDINLSSSLMTLAGSLFKGKATNTTGVHSGNNHRLLGTGITYFASKLLPLAVTLVSLLGRFILIGLRRGNA